jgi:hypothetical protein
MTKTRDQLIALLQILDEAAPCDMHDREALHICISCGETVECADCEPIPCQCWNDE